MFTNRHVLFFAFVAVLLFPAVAAAQLWTPFPPLQGNFGVEPALDGDRWDATRSCLPSMSSAVGASYYAVVVSVTDRGGNATPAGNDAVPYVDALYDERWHSSLDNETHVLIALGLDNRAVAIHPGTQWVGWGFEQGAITSTIDGSAFKSYARSGDYANAICVLANAVDARLARLRDEAIRSKEQTRAKLQVLRQDLQEASALLDTAREAGPELRAAVEDEIRIARDRTQAASAALDDRSAQAASYAESAAAALNKATRLVGDYRSLKSNIPRWDAKIATLRTETAKQPHADTEATRSALGELDRCEQLVESSLHELVTLGYDSSSSIRHCIGAVERRLESAESAYIFTTRTVPITIGAIATTGLFVFLIVAAVRRRRVERLVEGQLGNWKDALGTASERLLDLETEFSMYFDPGRPAWKGASQELDQACADEVNRVFLMFSKAQDIYDDARAAFDDAPPLLTGPLDAVQERLDSATVHIETGEKETKRRIFLPLTQSYSASASKLLTDLNGSYERAAKLLEEATGLMERVDELRVETSSVGADLVDEIQQREQLGLPQAHLLGQQVVGERKRSDGVDVATTDPRTSAEHLLEALDILSETRRIASVGNGVALGVRENLPVRQAGLRARIDKMREHGWVAKEPGFDPDQRLDQATRGGQRALEAVAAAEEERAHEIWEAIGADLALLDEQLAQIQDARDGLPPRIDAMRQRHAENESRVPDVRRALDELRDKHHPDAFSREGDNLEEYRELREQVLEGLRAATDAHAEQRYLAAIGDVENLHAALQLARELIDQVHDVAARLEKAQEDARTAHQSAVADHAAIDELRDGRLGVDGTLAAEITASESVVKQLGTSLGDEKPHWFELAREAAGAKTRAADLREEVTAEVESHERAVDRLATLKASAEELAGRVRSETRDRPHVGRIVSDAQAAIERVGSLTNEPQLGGEELANAVANASEWLDRARYEWRAERDLFRHAESELAAARSRYDVIHGSSYGYGVEADCSHVEDDLDEARRAADQRDWDEVVRIAAAVKTAVNKENNSAEAEASRKRRAAQRAARASSSSSSYSSSSSSYSSFSSSSSSSFSSSSWSSSSSSFSGGSSYSSSSGGSSW